VYELFKKSWQSRTQPASPNIYIKSCSMYCNPATNALQVFDQVLKKVNIEFVY